jgi:hypothetical protein
MEIKRYISREADLGGPPEEPPESIVVDGADHWEVECVLAERTKDRLRAGGMEIFVISSLQQELRFSKAFSNSWMERITYF